MCVGGRGVHVGVRVCSQNRCSLLSIFSSCATESFPLMQSLRGRRVNVDIADGKNAGTMRESVGISSMLCVCQSSRCRSVCVFS